MSVYRIQLRQQPEPHVVAGLVYSQRRIELIDPATGFSISITYSTPQPHSHWPWLATPSLRANLLPMAMTTCPHTLSQSIFTLPSRTVQAVLLPGFHLNPIRTLNESDVGKYCDDILSLAKFSCGDIQSSDRGSVFTAKISTSPASSRPTPRGGSHDQLEHQRPLSENAGQSASGWQPLSSRADKRTYQPVSPHLILSSRKSTIRSTSEFKHDSYHPGVSFLIETYNKDLPLRTVLTK